jgi:hypothetical protein
MDNIERPVLERERLGENDDLTLQVLWEKTCGRRLELKMRKCSRLSASPRE